MDGEEEREEWGEGCSMAREVLDARMISMIMPLQSQQMFMRGPRTAAGAPPPAALFLLVGSVMDWERCSGRLPFWCSTTAMLLPLRPDLLPPGGAAVVLPPDLVGSEKYPLKAAH